MSARNGGELRIGLVNNMADGALEVTERRFTSLLTAAAGSRPIRILPFWLNGIPRAPEVRSRIGARYLGLDELFAAGLDGMVVTGAEPTTSALSDEPFWPELLRLIDWSRTGVASTIWSCLAAHAAVLRLDCIPRRPLPAKCSGVFDCVRVEPHELLRGLPSRLRAPHSRCNGLDECELVRHGYRILTRTQGAGVDMFMRRGASLSLFLQGHPEYEGGAPQREYLRDVGRFLNGRGAYPHQPPAGCFDVAAASAFERLADEAVARPRPELLDRYRQIVDAAEATAPWRPAAERLFRNWLGLLAPQPAHAGETRRVSAQPPYSAPPPNL